MSTEVKGKGMINSIGKFKICVCDKDDNRKRCYFDFSDAIAALLNPDQSRSVVVGHQSSFVDLVSKNTLVTSECLSSINYHQAQLIDIQRQNLGINQRILSCIIDDKYQEAVKEYKKLTARIDSWGILQECEFPQDSNKLLDLHSNFLEALTNLLEYIENEPIEYINTKVVQSINKSIDYLVAILIEKFKVDHSVKLKDNTILLNLSDESLERKLDYQICALCSKVEGKLHPIEDKLTDIICSYSPQFVDNYFSYDLQGNYTFTTIQSMIQSMRSDWFNYSVQFYFWTKHPGIDQKLIDGLKQEYKNYTFSTINGDEIRPFEFVDIDNNNPTNFMASLLKSCVINRLIYSFTKEQSLLLEILKIHESLNKKPTFRELFGNFINEDKSCDDIPLADFEEVQN